MRPGKQDSAKVTRRENISPAGEVGERGVQAGCWGVRGDLGPALAAELLPARGWGWGAGPRPAPPAPAPPPRWPPPRPAWARPSSIGCSP